MFQDLRFGARMLLKHKAFTVVSVLTLALGIGATSAIFGIADALLVRPLPVQSPEQLVLVNQLDASGGTAPSFSYPIFEQLRDQNQVLAGLLAVGQPHQKLIVNGQDEAAVGGVALVSENYFTVLGVGAKLGRTFGHNESDGRVAVISHAWWSSSFANDPAAVGKTIMLNEQPFTVIGVMPLNFLGESVGNAPAIWIPFSEAIPGKAALEATNAAWLQLLGRLKPGVITEQAQASLDLLFQQITFGPGVIERPNLPRIGNRIELLPGFRGRSELRRLYADYLRLLMLVVGIVWLIVSVNLATLMLARLTARQKELATRLALGAGRGQLIRLVLTESLLLAGAGALLGCVFAYWASKLLLNMISTEKLSASLQFNPDYRILWFTAALSLLAVIIFGLIPALLTTRFDLSIGFKESLNLNSGAPPLRWGRLLVVAQFALSLVLLVGAGLFVRTLANLKSFDPGFQRDDMLAVTIRSGSPPQPGPHFELLGQRLLERVQALPGVLSASRSRALNFMLRGSTIGPAEVEGYQRSPREDVEVQIMHVTPEFFDTLGISLFAGRKFNAQDNQSAPKVAIINQSMARYFFRDGSPLGRVSRQAEIVGVVNDTKFASLRERAQRIIYVPYVQSGSHSTNQMVLEIRTSENAAAVRRNVIATIRSELALLAKDITDVSFTTLGKEIEGSILQERLAALISSFFGGVALLLVSIGLYGILSYNVNRRTSEIGIRIALGAQRKDIIRLVVQETLLLTLAGVALGLPAALATMRMASGLLFGLSAYDPATFTAAIVLLAIVALLACWLPTRRATRIDPRAALRRE